MTTTAAISAPLSALVQACAAVLPHASKDDATPVIECARVSGSQLITTDRYSIARYDLSDHDNATTTPAFGAAPEAGFLVPRAAIEWVAKITPKALRRVNGADWAPERAYGYVARFETDAEATAQVHGSAHAGTVTASIILRNDDDETVERSQAFDVNGGGFPAVERLMPTADSLTDPDGLYAGPLLLTPEALDKVTTYAKKWHKSAPVEFTATKSSGSTRPSPIYFRIGALDGVLQPNMPRPAR